MTDVIKAKIAVVGAGPAGLAAALAARSSGSIAIVDDNRLPGGQIWRADKRSLNANADAVVRELRSDPNIRWLAGTQVFAIDGRRLFCESDSGVTRIEFGKLIIATGARELLLPFPGWTLPNVFGAGGLQAMVKGGLNVAGKRIVVAGTGPLLLAVAEFLKSKRAEVVLLAEQATRKRIIRFGLDLWRSPSKVVQGIGLLRRLSGVRTVYDSFVVRANGSAHLKSVTVRIGGYEETIGCDMLACGYHLVPNIELAEHAGCRIEDRVVAVDDFQQTSVDGIYCAGEPTGIGGLEQSLAEGTIAGASAVGKPEFAAHAFKARKRFATIADSMNHGFALRDEMRTLCDPDTIVCRCEDATYGEMASFADFRSAKLQTRCGMGSCRGRICGAAARTLFGWEPDSVRPPIFPVRAGSLARFSEDQEQL